MTAQASGTLHCLTWHGTVLRIHRTTGRLIHALPWPLRPTADDWRVELPAKGLTARTPSPTDPALFLLPAGQPSLLHFERDGRFLCAEPHAPHAGEVRFSRTVPSIWETFLLLAPQDLARLRSLLGARWVEGGGEGDGTVPSPLEGFRLLIDDCEIDLRCGIPGPEGASDSFVDAASGRCFRKIDVPLRSAETPLARRRPELNAPQIADAASFRATPDSRVNIPATGALAREFGFLPLAASRADEDWMQRAWRQPGPRRLGAQSLAVQAVRESDKYLLLSRGQEGVIFDESGASNETGYLFSNVRLTGHETLRREGDEIFITHEALDAAPHLAGAYAVFYNGHLSNYYHWVIEGLLPLHALAPYLPAGTKLLLPGTLSGFKAGRYGDSGAVPDHLATLQAWGFGDWPAVTVEAPVCHLEEVYWIDRAMIEEMPGHLVREARAHVLGRLGLQARPQEGARKRVYIARRGARSVENKEPVERIATNNGFSMFFMEEMKPSAQIELLAEAEFVIAPHGAGLSNLLFCAPGTKVIEFTPDCEFRPLFAQISDKLGLSHAVLPCPTHDGGFYGRMQVDITKFRALLAQMLIRL